MLRVSNIGSWRSHAVIVFVLVLAVIITGCGNVMAGAPVVSDPNGGKTGNRHETDLRRGLREGDMDEDGKPV